MAQEVSLLKTSVELTREFGEGQIDGNGAGNSEHFYYRLSIGTDPHTRVTITDEDPEALLNDLPNILSTVIQSQVLMETIHNK